MRNLSANQKIILALDNISGCYLVKIETPSQTIWETNHPYDIVVPSIGTFKSNAGLLAIESPRLSSSIDRETYKLAYIDPTFEKRALFEQILTGSKLYVYVCFFNTTGNYLGTFAPGAPLTDQQDLLVAYQGLIDGQGYALNPEEGSVVASIEGASPMANLGLTRAFLTTKEAMRQVNTNDTSFDQVYTGSKKMTYMWGKA
jgi:hypothetical protein